MRDGIPFVREHLTRVGYFCCFLFLACGSARLARFNIMTNPVLKNPGRPDRKYFAGLPIPAGGIAGRGGGLCRWRISRSHGGRNRCVGSGDGRSGFSDGEHVAVPQFQGSEPAAPALPLLFIFLASFIFLLWNYSQIMLLTMIVLVRRQRSDRAVCRHSEPCKDKRLETR